ncbi:putative snapin/pallidin/Snn1 [Tanacetum coccineum]
MSDNNSGEQHNTVGTTSSTSSLLNGLVTTIIKDFDSQSQQTLQSQDQLSSSILRLTNELDQLLADAPSPFIMQHASKITSVRKRVSSLNSLLKSIQRRVDNIDRLVAAGLPHDEKASGSGSSVDQ